MQSTKSIKSFLSNEPTRNITNWLYHHTKLLGRSNVLTGEQAHNELTDLAVNQVDKGLYTQAMTTICKLVDIRIYPDSFYDSFSYERLNPNIVRHRIIASNRA